MATCKRTPLSPTAMEAAAMTAGPVRNLTAMAKAAMEFPHAMILGCKAMNRPVIHIKSIIRQRVQSMPRSVTTTHTPLSPTHTHTVCQSHTLLWKTFHHHHHHHQPHPPKTDLAKSDHKRVKRLIKEPAHYHNTILFALIAFSQVIMHYLPSWLLACFLKHSIY